MARSLIPPTYKDLVRLDPETGRIEFDPEWLNWFLRIRQIIDSGGTVGPIGPMGPPGVSLENSDSSGGGDGFEAIPGPRGPAGLQGLPGAAFFALIDSVEDLVLPWVPSTNLPFIIKSLSAATTVYVRTDGNDNNDGFANTTVGAWLTIQRAINVVKTWNLNGFQVTIQVADGTYTGAILVDGAFIGGPASGFPVILQGNTGTPANVVVNVTGNAVTLKNGAFLSINSFKIISSAVGLEVEDSCLCNVGVGMDFGACTSAHMQAYSGRIYVFSNYTISGSATHHLLATYAGKILGGFVTVTLTGTPAFSVAFAYANTNSIIAFESATFSGSATGKRYNVTQVAVITTNGGGATYFPGNVAGTADATTFSIYV